MEVIDVCPPRWATTRDPELPTDGDKLEKVANLMGFSLYQWQRQVADTALERVDGHYWYRTVGVAVGRQSGKSKLVETRIAYELLKPRHHVAYTAQDRNMAKLKWQEHVNSLERCPGIAKQIHRISYINGSERVFMKNGSTYGIVTPNDKGARGMSLNLMVIDEALMHPLSLIASLQPTLATRKDGQLWILSNAGIPGKSELLQHYRGVAHSGISDKSTRLAWFEWCPREDKFDYMDEAVWAQAIPSLNESNGVLIEAVREAANTNSPEIFTKEWLNVWPAMEAVAVIDVDLWDSLARTDVTIGSKMVLGVDISRERDRSSIAVSSLVKGFTPVEIIDAKEGANWVLPRVIELAKKWKTPVVIDSGSPAASMIGELENAGVSIISIGLRDYARACGSFYDAVQAKTICHLDDPNLRQAIVGSTKRALGDSWAWSRNASNNITPLVAATLARYGVVNEPVEMPVARSKIF
jgi:Phage Terminase